VYVNDAFAEAHRDHASTFGVAERLPAYAGLTLAVEVNELSKVMTPERPALFLLGGAKFETKMPLIEKYLDLYDFVFIGGALTNDVLKARGLEVGQSLVSDISLKDAPFLWSEKLLVPVDVIVDGPRGVSTKPVDQVLGDEKILDCGGETVMMLERYINEASTILWNGPFGNYEAGFTEGTELTAELIAKAKAFSVIGGGDTVAAVEKLGLNDKFGFVSIGGGSMLTLLEHGTTSVLELLRKS
jgi:phosphoglycerate kinase